LGVWAGLKEPHFAALQLTCQSTPSFPPSLERVAIIMTCPPVAMEEGGACVNVMERGAFVAGDVFVTHEERRTRAERSVETSNAA
jgi:hypothetical protein